MAAPYSSGGSACSSLVITANGSYQLGIVSGTQATAAAVKQIQGSMSRILVGLDSSATTISLYDGTSTGGRLMFQTVTPASIASPLNYSLDLQALVGLFLVVSGGTSPLITAIYA